MRKIIFTSSEIAFTDIQKNWDKFFDKLSKANMDLNNFVGQNASTAVKLKMDPFLKSWQNFKDAALEFDNFLESAADKAKSIKPVDVELPFDTETFKETWQYWKDYLMEQHHICLQSRTERKQLQYLSKYSEENEEKATEILDYAISRFYVMFFKLDERKKEKKEQLEEEDNGEY